MSKVTLLAGKDSPASNKCADGLHSQDRQVVVTGNTPFEADASAEKPSSINTDRHKQLIGKISGTTTIDWNRSSPLSSRALVLTASSMFSQLDEAILYFDEELFASQAKQLNIEECSSTSDTMILSYQYLTLELIKRYEAKQTAEKPGTLVFVFKDSPSVSDSLRSASLRNGAFSIASPVVSAAASAFVSFAENIAALYSAKTNMQILLVHNERGSEFYANDYALGEWLATYIDSLDSTKGKTASKKLPQWIKPGTKATGSGFSFFSKK